MKSLWNFLCMVFFRCTYSLLPVEIVAKTCALISWCLYTLPASISNHSVAWETPLYLSHNVLMEDLGDYEITALGLLATCIAPRASFRFACFTVVNPWYEHKTSGKSGINIVGYTSGTKEFCSKRIKWRTHIFQVYENVKWIPTGSKDSHKLHAAPAAKKTQLNRKTPTFQNYLHKQ